MSVGTGVYQLITSPWGEEVNGGEMKAKNQRNDIINKNIDHGVLRKE